MTNHCQRHRHNPEPETLDYRTWDVEIEAPLEEWDRLTDMIWDPAHRWYRRLEGQADTHLFVLFTIGECLDFLITIELMAMAAEIDMRITNVTCLVEDNDT